MSEPVSWMIKAMPASPTVRIFLSTVSDEFRAYRDKLHRDLACRNVDVEIQEEFKVQGARPSKISKDGNLPDYMRQPVAIGLTIEKFSGALLGIAAQALLAFGLVFHLMPQLGLNLLDRASAVTDYDIPTRIGQLLASL